MKIFTLSIIFSIASIVSGLSAQHLSPSESLRLGLLTEEKAMRGLYIWGTLNLWTGVAGAITHERGQAFKSFSATNGVYGAINSTLGILSASRLKKQVQILPSLQEGRLAFRKRNQFLVLRSVFNSTIVITGIAVRQGGKDRIFSKKGAQEVGIGTSMIIQSSTLLLFDIFRALSYRKVQLQLSPVLTPNGAGLGFQSNLERVQPQPVAWF